jgi:hypothetical protein
MQTRSKQQNAVDTPSSPLLTVNAQERSIMSQQTAVVNSFVRSGGSPPNSRKSKPASAVPSATPIQAPLLVPVAEAARLLSVSAWEIRRLCRKGVLGYKKLGRTKWLITSRSINSFASEAAR